MNKTMHDVSVNISDGQVFIEQRGYDGLDGTHDVVKLNPDQIDLLIEWLSQARDISYGLADAEEAGEGQE
jgi:hypothetical protein